MYIHDIHDFLEIDFIPSLCKSFCLNILTFKIFPFVIYEFLYQVIYINSLCSQNINFIRKIELSYQIRCNSIHAFHSIFISSQNFIFNNHTDNSFFFLLIECL